MMKTTGNLAPHDLTTILRNANVWGPERVAFIQAICPESDGRYDSAKVDAWLANRAAAELARTYQQDGQA